MYIPLQASEITPGWLTQALLAGTDSQAIEVETVRAERIGVGRGFIAQVFRLQIDYRMNWSDAPSTLIAKIPSADATQRGLHKSFGIYRKEVRFYRELAQGCPVDVPRCYFAELDPESGMGALLLEDIGEDRETFGYFDEVPPDRAMQGAQALARLHAHYWDRIDENNAQWLIEGIEQRSRKAAQRVNSLWDAYQQSASTPFPDAILDRREAIVDAIARKGERMLSPATTLVHGDCWGSNMFFQKDRGTDGICLIDWQTLSWGVGASDLAVLIAMGIDSDLRKQWGATLLAVYHHELCLRGVENYPIESLMDDYHASLLSNLLIPILGQPNLDRRRQSESQDPAFVVWERAYNLSNRRLIETILETDALSSLDTK